MTQEQQLTKNIIEEFTSILKFLETKTPEEINSVEIPEEMNELMQKLNNSLGQLDSMAEQINSIVEQANIDNELLKQELEQSGISHEEIKQSFSSGNTRSIEDDELEAAAAQLQQEISQFANQMNITLDVPVTPVKAIKNETTDNKSTKNRERTLKKRLDLI